MQPKDKKAWWQVPLELFAQLSGWVVFPILTAVYLGRWLDKKYDKEPWLFLICVGVAFIITNIGVVMIGMKAMKQIAKDDKESKNKSDKDKVKDKS
jgi:hypothetical protein